jgi:hypothetical protein
MFRPPPHFVPTSLVRKISLEEAEQILGHHFDRWRAEYDQMVDASPLRGRSDVSSDRESHLRLVAHLWESFKTLLETDCELWYFDYTLEIGTTRPRQQGIVVVEDEKPVYSYVFFQLRQDAKATAT